MLIREIELFLRDNKITKSRLGRLAVGDPRIVTDISRGRAVNPKLAAKLRQFMVTFRPEDFPKKLCGRRKKIHRVD